MTSQPGTGSGKAPAMTGRSTARLLAVQAVYQIEMTGIAADRAMSEFIQHRLDTPGEEGEAFAPADRSTFVTIVAGVSRDKPALDEAIGGALDPSWTTDRLEAVLLAILRCGVFELRSCPAVPTGAIINEYIDIAHAFYGGKEPALVHAVLDRLGRVLRAEDGSAA
ncbi:MAG: transcription antitermination factor NusB [Alphaproteobacteria bacterium]|jgi:N utilization substance protein B